MKLAVFSDLHLAPGATNRCTTSVEELVGLFEQAEAAADRVLVGGDLFDLDRPTLPGAWRRQLREVRAEFPEVTDRLDGYEWIFGNHDGMLCRMGVPEERSWVVDGLSILALHGHQFDMPLKKLPGLAPAANFAAGWLERAGLDVISDAMGVAPLVFDRLWHTQSASKPGPDRSVRGAAELMGEEEWDLLICGHSHLLRLVALDGGLFVNTGALCCGHLDWVLVDTEQARVSAFRDAQLVQQATRAVDSWIVEGSPVDDR